MTDGGPGPNANQLAQTRTDLAGDRTVMAADRTLMAWIRTALAMISFGFTIYKFLSYLKGSETLHAHNPEGPRYLGILLTGLGSVSLAAGRSLPSGQRNSTASISACPFNFGATSASNRAAPPMTPMIPSRTN